MPAREPRPSAPDDLHAGRAYDAPSQRVALAQDVAHDGLLLAFAVARLHQRFVERRVERLALRVDALQPLRAKRLQQLRVHELDPVEELLEVGLSLRGHERQLELVQYLEQAPHQRLGSHLHRAGLFLQHPLPVVVEVGRQALEVVAVLRCLLPRLVDRPGLGLGGPRFARGRGRRCLTGGIRPDATLVGHAHARPRFLFLPVSPVPAHPDEAPPSSTISPSTTSPSPEEPDSPDEPPAAAWAPDPPAACCCAYMACPTFWKACIKASVAALIRFTSSPFSASLTSSFALRTDSRSASGTLSPYSESALSTW